MPFVRHSLNIIATRKRFRKMGRERRGSPLPYLACLEAPKLLPRGSGFVRKLARIKDSAYRYLRVS